MVEINLLPSRYKKRINILAYVGDFIPYLLLGLAALVAVNVLLGLASAKRAVTVGYRESRWKENNPQFEEIASLKEDIAKKTKECEGLTKLAVPKMNFSNVMYILYKELPINIWFRSFSYTNNTLIVRGAALDFEKDASLTLKDYVDKLSASELADGYASVKVKSQDQVRMKDKIVLYFELELHDEDK